MNITIKNQAEFDSAVKINSMINNIQFDNDMNYNPIDWDKEYVVIINEEAKTTVKRMNK